MYSTLPKEQSFNVWNLSDQQLLQLDQAKSGMGCLYWKGICFVVSFGLSSLLVFLSPGQAAGSRPLRSAPLTGLLWGPAVSSLSPPFSNIPFTPEITLFISRIIVSSWMRELCRHSSELKKSVGIGEGRGGCASGVWGVFHVLMSSFRMSRKTSRLTCSWPSCFAWQRERGGKKTTTEFSWLFE